MSKPILIVSYMPPCMYSIIHVVLSQKVFSLWSHTQKKCAKSFFREKFPIVICHIFLRMGSNWKYLLRLSHLYTTVQSVTELTLYKLRKAILRIFLLVFPFLEDATHFFLGGGAYNGTKMIESHFLEGLVVCTNVSKSWDFFIKIIYILIP